MDNNMDGAGDDDDTESPDTRDDCDDSASLPELALSSDSDDGEDDDDRSPRQMTAVKSSIAPPLNEATLTSGDTCSIAPFVDSLPSALVTCTLFGVKRVLCRSLLSRNAMMTVLTISLPTTLLYPFASPCDSQQDKDNVSALVRSSRTWERTHMNQLLQPDAETTCLHFALPPLRASRQDSDNARPSIDTFETEPGRQPGVLILPLHSTLIPPESFGTSATERLISVSLPPLNPFASMCDFRQDTDNGVRLLRPWLQHVIGFGLDRLRDDLCDEGFQGFEPMLGAYVVADAFATYRWDHGRNLWLPVYIQAMVVAVSNHRGWDPGRAFWRSLRHHEPAPTRLDIDVDFDGKGNAGDVSTGILLADDDPG